MKIESKIKRAGGSHIPIGTTTYHFAPQDDGAHVADVLDEEHQDRFLSITEGYRLYRKGQAAATIEQMQPQPVAAPVAVPAVVAASLKYPDTFTIGGATVELHEVIALAKAAGDLSDDLWSDLTVDEQSDKIDAQLDAMQEAADAQAMQSLMAQSDGTEPDHTGKAEFDDGAPAPAAPAAPAPGDDRDALAARYKELNGKLPHHKWSIDKIREEIAKG